MSYHIQVDSGKYSDPGYLNLNRWSTYSLIVRQIIKLKPKKVLEIGPGNHMVSTILKKMDLEVKTLDFDSRLSPDYVCDIMDHEKFPMEKFDCIIASQVFEHIGYFHYLEALKNLRNSTDYLLLTLPYTSKHSVFFHFSGQLPIIERFSFSWKFIFKKIDHQFDGQHYWEIGKKKFGMKRIRKDILDTGWQIAKRFINPQNPYHYFFILK
jgi:hypothetical protein